MKSFVIPVSSNDELELSEDVHRYAVQNKVDITELSDSEIRHAIIDISDTCSVQPDQLFESTHFDMLYSILIQYHTLNNANQQLMVSFCTAMTHTVLTQIRAVTQSNEQNHSNNRQSIGGGDDSDELIQAQHKVYCNVLRAAMYLVCTILQQLSNQDKQNEMIVDVEVNKKSKKKSHDAERVSAVQLCEDLCQVLLSVISCSAIYQLQTDWHDIGALVLKSTATLLGNANQLKTITYRDILLDVYALNVKKFDLYTENIHTIVHTITHCTHESIALHMSKLISVFVHKHTVNNVIAELLNELQTIDRHLLSDANVCKSVSTFIVDIAVQCPKQMLHNCSLLMNYLEHDNYMIRNAILLVFGELIEHAFIVDTHSTVDDSELIDGLTPQQYELRESLYDILDERKHDINSFTRSKVLQVWISIGKNRKITIQQLSRVARIGLDRLSDKSSHVRKYAIQLLYTLLQYQPISSNLHLTVYTQQLQDKGNSFKHDIEQMDAQRRQSQSVKHELDEQQQAVLAKQHEMMAQRKLQLDILMLIVDYLSIYKELQTHITRLLTSKTTSDVIECIEYCVIHKQFNCIDSDVLLKSMCSLVWSREPTIRDTCIDAYKRIYLSVDLDTLNQALAHKTSVDIARELTQLFSNVSLSVQTSLEQVVLRCVQLQYIHTMVIHSLFDIFQSTSTTSHDRIVTLNILSSFATELKSIITGDIQLQCIIGIGLSTQPIDLQLARVACQMLGKLDYKTDHIPTQAYTQILKRIQTIVWSSAISQYDERHWYACCEQIINLLYKLHTEPDRIMAEWIKHLTVHVFGDNANTDSMVMDELDHTVATSPVQLSRLLFVVGHAAVKSLVQLEQYEVTIKKLKSKQMIRLQEQKHADYIESQTSTQRKSSTNTKSDAVQPGIEDELAVTASEEYELEQLREWNEKSLCDLQVNQQQSLRHTLLSIYLPIIRYICQHINQTQYKQQINLSTTAVLALCKFMTLTDALCEQNIQLLISILRQSESSTIKSNIIIGLGDLVYRWPNTIEPWSEHMYIGLSDTDISVRKHTLLVLTHLILNDMLKVKTPIADIALCIVDTQNDIANIAKLFFVSLSEKVRGVGIHDVLPDIIQRLSMNTNVSTEHYQIIIRYITAFISKDKQIERLVDKLCHRFTNLHTDINQAITNNTVKDESDTNEQKQEDNHVSTENHNVPSTSTSDIGIKQCRDIAFCLSQLTYSVSTMKKLLSLFTLYSNKLYDTDVYESFCTIVSKSRKFAKADIKVMIDQLESQLISAREKCMEELNLHSRAQQNKNKHAAHNHTIQHDTMESIDDNVSDTEQSSNSPIVPVSNVKQRTGRHQSSRIRMVDHHGGPKKRVTAQRPQVTDSDKESESECD